MDPALRHATQAPEHDPSPLPSFMGAVTTRIGLGATSSISHQHPFHAVRLWATRDHLTRGYAELGGVMIRGRCEILDDESSVRAAFAALAEIPADASPVQPGALASAPKRMVRLSVPARVASWDHRTLGGRY